MLANIDKIFTEQDINEMRKAMKSIVIQQFKGDLEHYCEHEYRFDVDAIEAMFTETVNETLEEIKTEVKSRLSDHIMKNVVDKFNLGGDVKMNKDIIAIPPGETIKEQMERLLMDTDTFAYIMNFTEDDANKLLNGDIEITPVIAHKLEVVFGIHEMFWINLEAGYRYKLKKGGVKLGEY